MEPYELVLDRTAGSEDKLVLDIEAIGDTAAALAGESTYRELPEEWVRNQVDRHPELRVVGTKHFPMRLTTRSLMKQISYARRMTAKLDDSGLRDAYVRRIDALELELKEWSGTHRRGRNYAMVVQRAA